MLLVCLVGNDLEEVVAQNRLRGEVATTLGGKEKMQDDDGGDLPFIRFGLCKKLLPFLAFVWRAWQAVCHFRCRSLGRFDGDVGVNDIMK